jgi:hypothetical protein
MPQKTKRTLKIKRGGSTCSVFGKGQGKDAKAAKLKRIFNDLPPEIISKLEILLKKEPSIINEKLKGIKLEELDKQFTKNDDALISEISKEKTSEKKVSKYIEVRRKQLEEVKDPMIYSRQEIDILIEELNKLENVLSAKSTSATAKAANVTAKPANVTAKPANVTAKPANVTMSKSSENAKLENAKPRSTEL